MAVTEEPIDRLIADACHDREKLGELLECYRAYFLTQAQGAIGKKLGVKVSPADVVQQTLAEGYRAFDQFAGTTELAFSSWLQRIFYHRLTDIARRLRTQKRAMDREQPLRRTDDSASFCWNEPVADQTTPSQRVIRGEMALRLGQVLQSLPEHQREAVRMRYIEGLPMEQIAEELSRSVQATAGLIKRGLQKLRSKMNEDSWI